MLYFYFFLKYKAHVSFCHKIVQILLTFYVLDVSYFILKYFTTMPSKIIVFRSKLPLCLYSYRCIYDPLMY